MNTALKPILNFLPKIPTENQGIKKFFIVALMMLLTIYIYSILRLTKDALVIADLGAEVISALKLCGVLPSAIIFMLVYTKAANIFTRHQLYHVLIAVFVFLTGLFAFYLYPHASQFHIDTTEIQQKLPYLKYLIIMIANWPYSLFYISAELWGSAMLALTFWQFSNQVYSVHDAKVVYPALGFVAQFGMLLAGHLMGFFTKTSIASNFAQSLYYIIGSVIVSAAILSWCVYIVSTSIVGLDKVNGVNTNKKKKEKLGFVASLKYIFSSKYIGLIALLLFCYGSSINLVEGVWKKEVGLRYVNSTDIGAYMAQVMQYASYATLLAMLLAMYFLRKLSWRLGALASPAVILLTGLPFFGFIFVTMSQGNTAMFIGFSMLNLAVFFGSAQNVLSKAIKYAFFDPTKEMAYIPLDEELKSKGKAAADVIGGRLGKSGGAFIQFVLLHLFINENLVSLSPVLSVFFFFIMLMWIYGVFRLSVHFKHKMQSEGLSE